MTTSISKAVPRSRLNITYRTRIDGQVVRKELPLRLLVAGDFSGRATELLAPAEHARPLPHLSQRTIYSIGKEGTLESILSRSRISLPIPGQYASKRQFALVGDATVRVECNRDAEGKRSFQLWIKSSKVEQAVELKLAGADASQPREVAADTALYSGELFSCKASTIAEANDVAVAPVWPKLGADEPLAAVSSWRKKQTDSASAFAKGKVWTSAAGADLHGWLEPPVSPAAEPPSLFDLTGHNTKIWFQFDTDLDSAFDGDGRQSAEFRVRLAVTTIDGGPAIRLSDMISLTPERVARAVPEIRRLLVIRWLASQGRSMISANPVLRNHVKTLLTEQKEHDSTLFDRQKIIASELVNPAKASTVVSADPDAKNLKELLAKLQLTEDEKTTLEQLKKTVSSDDWALRNAAIAWQAEKAAVTDLLDATKNVESSDPDVQALRALRAKLPATPEITAQITALEATIRSAWAEKAARREPKLSPWQELDASVAGLNLENFKAQKDAK